MSSVNKGQCSEMLFWVCNSRLATKVNAKRMETNQKQSTLSAYRALLLFVVSLLTRVTSRCQMN